MIYHPTFLNYLTKFQDSLSQEIPVELLAFLVLNKSRINMDLIHDIIYKYKVKRSYKKENVKNIRDHIDKYFMYEETYKLKENIDKKFIKDIERSNEVSRKLGLYYILDIMEESGTVNEKIIKKMEIFVQTATRRSKQDNEHVYTVETTMEISDNQDNKTDTLIGKDRKNKLNEKEDVISKRPRNSTKLDYTRHDGDTSLLNFVIKKEKTNEESINRFKPITKPNTIYVYNTRNPNYVSYRKRKDLINPKKKIFINFTYELRPAIYKLKDDEIGLAAPWRRNSIKRIFTNINYDEESTWEDDAEGEDVNSDITEESDNESVSDSEEWIESDSNEEEVNVKVKRPLLTYPNIKIIRNTEYEDIWNNLTLEKTEEISEELLEVINEKRATDIKILSDIYLIKESAIRNALKKK